MGDDVQVGRLTIRQRRALGLTIPSVMAAARKLAKDGKITRGMDSRDICELIVEQIAVDNAQAWADNADVVAIDWDAILAFIERLIPLIQLLISIFAV
jgi:hypothetical protein